MSNGDMPANPIFNSEGGVSYYDPLISKHPDACNGLTKREAFAMAAMQGLLSDMDHQTYGFHLKGGGDSCAIIAVDYADALLKALAHTPNGEVDK